MDETREVALEARIQAANAHARLDGINGQITRLGDEQAQARVDMAQEFGVVKVELAKVKTRVGVYAAVGAFLASAVIAPVAVALTIHYATPQTTPAKTPSSAVADRHDVSVADAVPSR